MLSFVTRFSSKVPTVAMARAFSAYTPADGICKLVVQLLGLVDPEWLQQRLGKVRVFDATLHLDPKRNAIAEFKDVLLSQRYSNSIEEDPRCTVL